VRHADRLTIPAGAVLSESSGSYVFIVSADSTISKRTVTTGVDIDELIELTSGVAEGELVVVEGASVLVDGATIKDITVKATETGASK